MDLDSKEVLENALIDYPGTILFVSHDRYFINRIATKVIELSGEGTAEFLGDYDYYIEKKEEMLELERLEAESKSERSKIVAPSNKNSYQVDREARRLERQRIRRVEEIEEQLELLENGIAENEEKLCQPDVFENHEIVMEINTHIEQMKADIDILMEEWAELSELLQN